MRTSERVRHSLLAFSKSELLFQCNFCSKEDLSTKTDQKRSLTALWKALEYIFQFEKSIGEILTTPVLVRPSNLGSS